eukprot:1043005-Amphidinium_carterae.1
MRVLQPPTGSARSWLGQHCMTAPSCHAVVGWEAQLDEAQDDPRHSAPPHPARCRCCRAMRFHLQHRPRMVGCSCSVDACVWTCPPCEDQKTGGI